MIPLFVLPFIYLFILIKYLCKFYYFEQIIFPEILTTEIKKIIFYQHLPDFIQSIVL